MISAERLRLMPLVMTAAGALLVLKLAGFATHTSMLFVPAAHAEPAPEDAKHAGGAPEAAPATAGETPALPADHGLKEETKARGSDAAAMNAKAGPGSARDEVRDQASSERALLEALKKRRETLDARSSELDMRESLLAAAQQQLEARLDALKQVESRVSAEDARRAEDGKTRLKNLVTMYEGMKVKEAARIFEKLDAGVLLDVAGAMNPRKLSDVLGQMSPDAAQKLTVSLARREVGAPVSASLAANDLPKIEGRPAP